LPGLSEWGLTGPAAAWVAAAWLAEAALYIAPAFARLRGLLGRLPPRAVALLLTWAAAAPYLVYAPACGLFDPAALAGLLALAAALSFWYAVWPRGRPADLGFVALAAAVTLARLWKPIYPSPPGRLPMEVLGQLMWIRTGLTAALVLRRPEGVGFGWLPSWREWKIGARYFLYFLPVGSALALATGFARWEPKPAAPALILGTLLGMLWVVALSEEFFFRGLLQHWLAEWLAGERRGWLLASLLFGLAHLPFRGFPNWRFALLATAAGLFYGRAYRAGRGIRAAMVAHALTNTAWRLLLA